MSKKIILITLFLGIIASIVGGVIVENWFVPQNMAPENVLKVEATKVAESISDEVQKEPQIESDIENLQELFRIARKISGFSPRNEEYSKIIDQALSERKPEFAFTVAKAIQGYDLRNQEFSKIISQCLTLGRYELAIKVADGVTGVTPRNKEYKKIITAGMTKRKGSSFSK